MRQVVVNKKELLQTVRENRKEHKKTYEKACRIYRRELAEEFRELANRSEAGELLNPHANLDKPEHFLDEYDQAIEMLKMDTRERVELRADEFEKYVKDEWNWSRRFAQNTSSYVE